jgi:hypothetical protein
VTAALPVALPCLPQARINIYFLSFQQESDMGLLDLLQQAIGGNAQTNFDQLVKEAPPEQLGAGLAEAMR